MRKRIISFLICISIITTAFSNGIYAHAEPEVISNISSEEMVEISDDVITSNDGVVLDEGNTLDTNENITLGEDSTVGMTDEANATPETDAQPEVNEAGEINLVSEETNIERLEDTGTFGDLIVTEEVEDLEDINVNMGLENNTETAKYNSYLKLPDSTTEFFGGEIITVYNGITISGNLAKIPEDSYTLIYLSKDSFEKPSMKDISTSFEKIKNVEITETDKDYIIKTVYRNLYGGYDGATPVRVSLKRGLTKNLSEHKIRQEYYGNDDVLRATSNELKVQGKARLETIYGNNFSSEQLTKEKNQVDDNFVGKENTFLEFYPNYISNPNSNEHDPRTRRVYATVPSELKVKENSGWTYDEELDKWYKDIERDNLSVNELKIMVDIGGIDFSSYDAPNKTKQLTIKFTEQPIENGELKTDLGPISWEVKRNVYILKAPLALPGATFYVYSSRRVLYMKKDYTNLIEGRSWNSINTISIPYDKSQLDNIRMFFDHETISSISISNEKDDVESRQLIIKSSITDVPIYSYPSQIRLNVVGLGDDSQLMVDKLQGTKAYGIKFDGSKELITDNVPIITTDNIDNSVNGQNWFNFDENEYKSIEFVYPNEGITLTGKEEINKYIRAVHTNVVADLRERLIDDLKFKMDNNEEAKITARGSNIAGYPSYDDFSYTYVTKIYKVNDEDGELTKVDDSSRSDTDTYYTLQYEYIYNNSSLNITNGKGFFVEDTISTALSYTHYRYGNFSDATMPENLNIYYLVPDGLEPIENENMFSKIDIVRGYKDGYNLVVAKPKNIQIPSLIPNSRDTYNYVSNYYNLDFEVTKRMDIGEYYLYASLSFDNNKVDIKNGRQYGVLQKDTPSGVFADITKDAMNRPETNTKYTYFGNYKFNIYPPQSLVAIKDVKMSIEADGKYSSSTGNKATIGDNIDYRLRLRNNASKPITTLTILDILPFKDDKSIVDNALGEYTSRGSKFRTPLIGVEPQSKFEIYYSTSPVQGTIDENKNAVWEKDAADLSQVTMIKAVLKSGESIGVNEVYDIITHNTVEQNDTINDGEKAYNSFAISTNNEASFIETIKTEVSVNYPKKDVTIEKTDSKDENIKLEGVVFSLYSASDDRLIQTNLKTNRNGILVIPNLLVGKSYYLTEVSTVQVYKLIEQNIAFTVSDTEENMHIVIKNVKETVSIPVEKKWVGEVGSSVNIKLFADDVEKDTVTLNADNSWKHTFANLPKYNSETNEKISYTVKEEGANEENIISINDKTYEVSINGNAENGYIITNTEKTTESGGTSERDNVGHIIIYSYSNDTQKSFSFTVTLDNPNISGTYGGIEFVNGVAIFNLRDRENVIGMNVPSGVSYTVVENNNTGYTVVSRNDTGTIPKGEAVIVEFENNKIPTKSVSVEKKWVGEAGSSVNIKLFAGGVEKDTVTLNTDNNLKHTFENLPQYTTIGEEILEISYTVKEEGANENNTIIIGDKTYEVSITGNESKGYVITNTEKVKDGGNTSGKDDLGHIIVYTYADNKDKSFTFTVTLDNPDISGTYGELEFVDGVATFDLKDGENIIGINIPSGVSYTIVESDNAGYTVVSRNDTGSVPKNEAVIVEFLNNKIPTKSVSVEKKWVGEAGSSVNIKLFADGVEKDTVTLNGGNSWKHTFENLPKYNTDTNKEILYTVKEDGTNVDNTITINDKVYSVSVSGDMENGYIITNTEKIKENTGNNNPSHSVSKSTGNIIVTNSVVGENADKNKYFTFIVTLDRKDISGTYGDMKFVNGVSTFTLKDGEKKVGTDIPSGVFYNVVESDNEGYTVTKTNAVGNIPKKETVNVKFENTKINSEGTEIKEPSKPEIAKSENPEKNYNIEDKITSKNISLNLTAIKTLDGNIPNSDIFKFVLKDFENNIIQVKSNNGDKVTFDSIEFDKTGDYVYYLSEQLGNDSSINYDNSIYKISVTISENSNGILEASIRYEKNGQVYMEDVPVFSNTTKSLNQISVNNNDKQINNKEKSNKSVLDNVPKTEDTTDLTLWCFVAISSIISLLTVIFKLKKKN